MGLLPKGSTVPSSTTGRDSPPISAHSTI